MKFLPILSLVVLFGASISLFGQSDAELRSVTEKDRSSRDAQGTLLTLSSAEHASRGQVYFENRHFPEAREHFQKILDVYPKDAGIGHATFVIGRSYMWEREYAKAITYLERAAREFPGTLDGREAMAFNGACHVRLGKNVEAAKIYEQYITMYPDGERIQSAYLNVIDSLREAGKYDDSRSWVAKASQEFPGTATETNALQARLRMEIYRGRWNEAVALADSMLQKARFAGSMSSVEEVKYLKGMALEKSGRSAEAEAVFSSIPDTGKSYYGGLAAERVAGSKVVRTAQVVSRSDQEFPAPFRDEVLTYSRKRGLDPRFVLAIMKQESTFRPGVKSPSAARGLLQLTIDTASKYNKQAGILNLEADDLYDPKTNIAIGVEYLADLKKQFGGLYEAIAASYNGGEDNAARWLNRSKPREPAIFAAEVGFAETKNYVFKVMNNYRSYRQLYDENLTRHSVSQSP